jgi:hypothetical protein
MGSGESRAAVALTAGSEMFVMGGGMVRAAGTQIGGDIRV